MDLVAQTLSGDRLALARLISRVEDNAPSARQAMAALFPHTGHAHLIGVTGAPGTGKSTLVNQMAKTLRAQERTVGVVAVDPTSPFSGGALLGDRVRMRDLAGDPGIFIRSMATRGSLGGLAQATDDVVKILDAAGFDVVLIETVGAGQSEVEIARTAHSTVVIEAPGLGDDVQALKAGLLEIADVLVVNKSDRPEAARTVRALKATLALGRNSNPENGWEPPILQTVALDGTGVPELLAAVAAHRSYLEKSGSWAQRERSRARANLTRVLERELIDQLVQQVGPDALERWVNRIVAREADVYAAAQALIEGRENAS